MTRLLISLLTFFWLTIQPSFSQIDKQTKKTLKKEIETMIRNDQKHRWQIMYGVIDSIKLDSITKLSDRKKNAILFKMNSPEYGLTKKQADSLWTLQNKIDDYNLSRLKEITLTYGWPGKWITGNNDASVILLHSAENYKLEMFPILKEEIRKKHIKALEVAQMYDRMLIDKGETQLYGTFDYLNKDTGKIDPTIIEDINKTNAARKELGLKQLKKYRVKI